MAREEVVIVAKAALDVVCDNSVDVELVARMVTAVEPMIESDLRAALGKQIADLTPEDILLPRDVVLRIVAGKSRT